MAASATALNDIGANSNQYYQINRKFNSNENLLDNGVVSGIQQQNTDLEEIMLIEKAKSDSYMKYLDLQHQQQQLLVSTPKQSKSGKINRSSENSSPLTTTNSSPSGIISPTNSTSKIQQQELISTPISQVKRRPNEIDYYIQSPKTSTNNRLKPISIVVQQTPQNNSIVSKSASPSPSPKANEIWLEYGCI